MASDIQPPDPWRDQTIQALLLAQRAPSAALQHLRGADGLVAQALVLLTEEFDPHAASAVCRAAAAALGLMADTLKASAVAPSPERRRAARPAKGATAPAAVVDLDEVPF